MIDARGHVYPSTLADIQLKGIDREGTLREGQVELSHASAAIERAWIEPQDACGYTNALDAIEEADLIVFGPGSLYTSVIPNMLVGGFKQAINASDALTVFVCNVSNQQGETRNLTAVDHVKALCDHGLQDRLDAVLVHDHYDAGSIASIREPIVIRDDEKKAIEALGVKVFTADVVDMDRPSWHDQAKLAAALEKVMHLCRLPQK